MGCLSFSVCRMVGEHWAEQYACPVQKPAPVVEQPPVPPSAKPAPAVDQPGLLTHPERSPLWLETNDTYLGNYEVILNVPLALAVRSTVAVSVFDSH